MDAIAEQILLPLLGGFLFVLSYHRLRFLTLRTSGEKLFLIAGVAAVLLAVLGKLSSFNVHMLLDARGGATLVAHWRGLWQGISPFPLTHVLAFVWGPTLGFLFSKIGNRLEAFQWALEKLNDNFELMLESSSQRRIPILLTLRSGRVYVGIALSPASPTPHRTHFKILPLWSGYRVSINSDNDEAGHVKFTNDYQAFAEVVDAMREARLKPGDLYRVKFSDGSREIDFDPDTMGILLSKDDIEAATFFDFQVYAFLNRARNPELWLQASTPIEGADELPPNPRPQGRRRNENEKSAPAPEGTTTSPEETPVDTSIEAGPSVGQLPWWTVAS